MPSNFRLLFSFLLLHCLVKEVPSQSSVTNNDLAELSKAFEDNLAYFDREYKKLDSDAVLGLRVAEGYFHRILEDTERGKIKLSLKVYSNVTNLLNKVSEILQKILPLVQENDPLFYPALNSRWTYYKPYQFKEHEDVGERKEIKPGDAERFSHCVREIVGSKNSNSEPCTISDECKEAMMTRGAPEALLYYQAMFFVLGQVSGCLDEINSKMKLSGDKLSDHLHHICTSAYFSVAWLNFQGGHDAEGLISILKLSFSCGLLGYHQILEDRGLSNVVGWQLTSGCYGDYTRAGEEKDSETDVGKSNRELKSAYLGNGCISDVTGVGLGLLAVYLRWVLDPPPQVQPINLVLGAKDDEQTVSVYMFGLLLLTIVFLIAARRPITRMATVCHAILFGQRRR